MSFCKVVVSLLIGQAFKQTLTLRLNSLQFFFLITLVDTWGFFTFKLSILRLYQIPFPLYTILQLWLFRILLSFPTHANNELCCLHPSNSLVVGCAYCRFVGRLMLYLKAQTFCHVFLRVQVFTIISLDRLHVSSRMILATLTLEQEGGIGRLLLFLLIMYIEDICCIWSLELCFTGNQESLIIR